jgi:hypothetical protein
MSILWDQLRQINQVPPEVLDPIPDPGRRGTGFAVLCPVDATTDVSVRRNADLLRERFESAMGFSHVVETPPVVSSAAAMDDGAQQEGMTISLGLIDAFNPISENFRAARGDLVVVYLCSSTAVDPNMVVSTLQRYPALLPRMCVVFDCPLLSPFSVHAISSNDRRNVVLPPMLTPRDGFEGHITLKLLHALLDLGDGGRLPSIAAIAALISDVAVLLQGQHGAATAAWCSSPLTSLAKATFIACVSQPIYRDAETNEMVVPDGRAVGGNVKRIVLGSKIRLVLDKKPAFILAFATDRMTYSFTVDDAHEAFDVACSEQNLNTPSINFVTYDGRVHASLQPADFAPVIERLMNGSLTLREPASRATMRWLYLGVSYKFEVVSTYREYLLMDALTRLRSPASAGDVTRQVILEDLGLAVVAPPIAPAPTPEVAMAPLVTMPRSAVGQQQQQHQQHNASSMSNASATYGAQDASASQQQHEHRPRRGSMQQQQQQQPQPTLTATAPQSHDESPTRRSHSAANHGGGGLSEADVQRIVDKAIEGERAARERDLKAAVEERNRALAELRDRYEDKLREERLARERIWETMTRDFTEIRGKAADHVAVERALSDVQHTIGQLTRSQVDEVKLKSFIEQAIDDLRRQTFESEASLRQAKDDIAAVASVVQTNEESIHKLRGNVVGLEQRQEASARELRDVRDSSLATTAVAGSQLPDVLDAARELSSRVKVIEVAIDRLYNGATTDIAAHARRLATLERAVDDTNQSVADSLRRQAASPGGSSYCTAREVEAIASGAANASVARMLDQVGLRLEKVDSSVRMVQQAHDALETRVARHMLLAQTQPTAPPPQPASAEMQHAVQHIQAQTEQLDRQLRDLIGRVTNVEFKQQQQQATQQQQQQTGQQQFQQLYQQQQQLQQQHQQQQTAASLAQQQTPQQQPFNTTFAAPPHMPTAGVAGAAGPTTGDVDAISRATTKNTADIKDLRQRVQRLEVEHASVQGLLEHETERGELLHRLDVRVDALEAQVGAAQQLKRSQSALLK